MNTITKRAAAVTAALMLTTALAACGDDEPTESAQTPAAQTPAAQSPMEACVDYYTENPASTVDVPVEEFCEAEREFDPAAFDSRFGEGEAAMQDEVGDGGAYGPMEVCIQRLDEAGYEFGPDTYEDGEEACNWQRALGEEDFAILYNDSVPEAEQQAAADRLQAVADEVVEQADEALEDEDW